jgi:hypothetical protein
VRLKRIFLWLALLAALPPVVTGCGGINASESVSPATFLLPGLLKNDAPTNAPALTPQISTEIATVRP